MISTSGLHMQTNPWHSYHSYPHQEVNQQRHQEFSSKPTGFVAVLHAMENRSVLNFSETGSPKVFPPALLFYIWTHRKWSVTPVYKLLITHGTNPPHPARKQRPTTSLSGTHSIFHRVRSGIRQIHHALLQHMRKDSHSTTLTCACHLAAPLMMLAMSLPYLQDTGCLLPFLFQVSRWCF